MNFNEMGTAAARSGDIVEAIACFDAAIAGDPHDWNSLAKLGSIYFDTNQFGQAYLMAQVAAKIHPSAETYSDLARVLTGLGEYEQALTILEQAHELNPKHIPTINNAGMVCINLARFDDAWDWFMKPEKVLGVSEWGQADLSEIERNKAFVLLQRGDWREGWRAYDLGIGHRDRVERFKGMPTWLPGGQGPTIIYGEQGIGDEVQFASCIPDALEQMDEPVIESMPRLVGLFSRSFPKARVYGTRYDDVPHWPNDVGPRTKISAAQLPGLYRNEAADFPGEPYLRACSGRRAMVRGLLAPMPRRKKIGISWKGGTIQTGFYDKLIDLKEMMTAFAHIDAEFINLEHTLDAERPEECGVHVFPYITARDLDYDYTAALVKELDLVVSVPNAVTHLAGALGTPCLVLLNDRPGWRYGGEQPWYGCVEVMRDWTLERVRDRIVEVLNGAE